MAIDLNKIIQINDATVTTGLRATTQAGIFLDQNPIIPFNGTAQQVLRFNDLSTVGAYFGVSSKEYTTAANYFANYDTATTIPPFCYFARYVGEGVAPVITGGKLDPVNNLADLQAITAGGITFNFNGVPVIISNMDFSEIDNFADAAAIVQEELVGPIPAATVVYDETQQAFIISNNDTSGDGTVDYCNNTPTTLAMRLTAATGASLFQGYGGAIAPYTRGAMLVNSDLTALKAITSGSLTVFFNSSSATISSINLSTATSFSSVASTLETALKLQIAAATVTYDSTTQAFTISNGDTSGNGTVSYCSDSPLAAALKIQQSSGAILSQGSPALTVTQNLNNIVAITRNWTAFTNLFDLPPAPNYDFQFECCRWVLNNKRYIYNLWSQEATLAIPFNQSNIAYAMVGEGLATLNADGTITYTAQMMPNFGPVNLAAFCMGMGAGIDYTQTDATINFAGKSQAGLAPTATTDSQYDALIANSFNFYGNFNSRSNSYNFTENGSIGGQFKYADNVYNQIWLDDQIQNSIAVLLQTLKRLPNNDSGYAILSSQVNGPLLDALNNGVVETGNLFDQTETARATELAGYDITPQLTNTGYVIQVIPATPAERATRAPVKGNVFYSNGSAINKLDFTIIYVQ